ncbi:MAG: hypothetical protein SGJ27_24750 [Candidatus Melainabacteria bacterium]|nr:hypothetical protein [Candidatus Melainabacteria bacterium]
MVISFIKWFRSQNMKKSKKTINPLYVIALVVSIFGGIAYGTFASKTTSLKQMSTSDLEKLLVDKETAHKNIEEIYIVPDGDSHWIVKLKTITPKEQVVRWKPSDDNNDVWEIASQYGIKMRVDHGESGSDALFKSLFGMNQTDSE